MTMTVEVDKKCALLKERNELKTFQNRAKMYFEEELYLRHARVRVELRAVFCNRYSQSEDYNLFGIKSQIGIYLGFDTSYGNLNTTA